MGGNTYLHQGFFDSARDQPGRTALEIGPASIGYGELAETSLRLAATLDAAQPEGPTRTGVFAHRTPTAFAGVLAALARGHTYVPLNRQFPPTRTATMITKADCRALIVDEESAAQLDDVLDEVKWEMTILAPSIDDLSALAERWPDHRFLGSGDVTSGEGYAVTEPDPEDLAYIVYTSGSTGTPKGIGATHANIMHYLGAVGERYGLTPEDRVSQTYDMTFDPSVQDMFLTWEAGATLCCLSGNARMKPGSYIRQHRLTVWFSVPSTAIFMKRLGELKPGRFPTLRWSLFCGEALPVDLAAAWQAAAPNSMVENLYGPTEVTVLATVHRWDTEATPAQAMHGVVPIGEVLPGTRAIVVDDDLREVAAGTEGELLLSGPQVTPGYVGDPEKTASAFIRLADEVHYRTGDRVLRREADGPLLYLGRVDFQVKVNGHRVELGEIEAALRDVTGLEGVVAMGWPPTPGGAGGVVAFVEGEVDDGAARSRLALRLPTYMVPREIHPMEAIPLNTNGKFDRGALRQLLEGGL